MGLLNLLGLRRRPRAASYYDGYADDIAADIGQWRPLHDRCVELRGAAANMGAESLQISNGAWQTAFGRGNDLGSMISVATYVAQVNPDDEAGGYELWARYTYTIETDRDWSYTGWASDPERENFGWLSTAIAEAEIWAENLAAGQLSSMENLPQVFGWDGDPDSVTAEVDG